MSNKINEIFPLTDGVFRTFFLLLLSFFPMHKRKINWINFSNSWIVLLNYKVRKTFPFNTEVGSMKKKLFGKFNFSTWKHQRIDSIKQWRGQCPVSVAHFALRQKNESITHQWSRNFDGNTKGMMTCFTKRRDDENVEVWESLNFTKTLNPFNW